MSQAWVEDARHFFGAMAERVELMDPSMREDSVKVLDGIYLDFCRALGLDPDEQNNKRLAWTMAFVGLRVADNRFRQYLKTKDWEATNGQTSADGTLV